MTGSGAPIGVALVGYGPGGAFFHAPLIASTPGLALRIVVTGDAARQTQVQRDHPGVEVLSSVEALWARAHDVQLVVISTPNRTHAALAEAALARGLHVVVDKPLAVTVDEAQGVARAAARAGRLAVPYQNRRWDGDFLTLRALVARGALGTVHHFESHFDRWRPQPKGGWRESGDAADAGGLLFDLGSHLIDQALVLLGPVCAVYAELDRRRAGVAAPDDIFVSLEHANGSRSHLHASALAGQVGPRFEVRGSAGAWVKWGMDVQEDALRAGARPTDAAWGEEPQSRWGLLGTDDAREPVPTRRGDYGAFYAGMRDAVRGDAPPPVRVEEGMAVLEVIEAAERSAREGRVVTGTFGAA
jgi:predicted dehydrogenase